MEFKLIEAKIKDVAFFLNKVKEKDEQYKVAKFCFFLGAGCSISSKLPSGGEIIKICKKYSFVENHPEGYIIDINKKEFHSEYLAIIDEFIETRREEYIEYEKKIEDRFFKELDFDYVYSKIPLNIIEKVRDEFNHLPYDEFKDKIFGLFVEKIHTDSLYGKWFEHYSEEPKGRQKFIENIIEQQKISGEYIIFANLIDQGLIHNVFTTNFDDMIYESLMLYTNKKARVYSHNEQANYIGIGSKKPNIIKLHGDYLFENIKNISSETNSLEKNMEVKFKETLTHLGLAVVGYGGADVSIMNALESVKNIKPFPLFWFGSNPNNLNWRVVNLINNTPNSYFVAIESFATLVLKLWSIDKKILKNIVEDATVRQKEMEDFLNKYNEKIQSSHVLTKEEKDNFNENIILGELFNKAYNESDQKKKIELYSRIIESNNKMPEAFNNRAIAYGNFFRYNQAIEDLNEAILLDSNNYLYYANRADVLARIGQIDNALIDVEKSLDINRTFVNSLATKASILSKQGKFSDAEILFEEAVSIDPDNNAVLMNLATHYLECNKIDKAIEVLEKIESSDIFDVATLYNNFAVAYRKKQQFAIAKSYVEKSLKSNKNHPYAYGTLALIYAEEGKKREFYENLELAYKGGCPVWNFLDDKAFNRYRNEEKFRKLMNMYFKRALK